MPLDIGVAFELPPLGEEEARKLANSTTLAADMTFVLNKKRIPHITLWQGRIPSTKISRALLKSFDEFSDSNFSILISMATTLVVRESGNVFWNVNNPRGLLDIHLKACKCFVPYSKGLLIPHHQRKFDDAGSSKELRSAIKKFGYSGAGPFFEPHVTIGRVRDVVIAKNAIEEIVTNRYDFEPTSLLLGKLGEYGDIIDIYKRIRLDYVNF